MLSIINTCLKTLNCLNGLSGVKSARYICYWLLAVILGYSTHGLAQTNPTETIRFDIPAGRLDQTLNHLARQSGVSIAMDAAQINGLTSTGLHGKYTVEYGLQQLLKSSGYAAEKSAAGYVLVQAQSGIRRRVRKR